MEAEEEKEDEVMSEIHLGCPPAAKSHFTRFTISPSVITSTNPLTGDFQENTNSNSISSEGEASSCQWLLVDKEGDLVLARRQPNPHNVRHGHDSILIHHHIITVIPSVGLQIWRASLILSDFVLHIHTSSYFNNVVALELGAGTGMVGILLARVACTVFITDKGNDILDNCLRNVELNLHTYKHNEKSVRVRQLDWQDSWPPKELQTEESLTIYKYKYSWTSSDIKEAEKASVLLAADVVYCDELTEAFFKVLKQLMPLGSKKVLFLSLEKRFNFTMKDLDIVAHGYEYFRTFIAEEVPESKITGKLCRDFLQGCSGLHPMIIGKRSNIMECDLKHQCKRSIHTCARVQPGQSESGISNPHFIGRRFDIASIPQYIREYDRGGDTELWEIRAKPRESITQRI